MNHSHTTSTHELTGVYWDKEFDAKAIDALFKEYLASLEEDEEGEEKKGPPPPTEIIKN
jgi:hypothetical protein